MFPRSKIAARTMTALKTNRNPGAFVPGTGQRVGLLAGSGALPFLIASNLRERGHDPYVIRAEGEASPDLAAFDGEVLALEQFARVRPALVKAGVTHLVLAGGIARRPVWHRFRWSWALLRALPAAMTALKAGDDVLLRAITRFVEGAGITVIGAHQVMPDLLAPVDIMGKHAPRKSDWATIEAAIEAARAIGSLDIGQAAVAFGTRAVALEGIEGTDGLLERTCELREHGRIASSRRGVLAKCAKPGQELRADMPSIGANTVELAHAAGLVGIAVDAERSLVLDFAATVETADRLGLFLVGLEGRAR